MKAQQRTRTVLRWTHITLGLVVMCYIYSPFGEAELFQWVMKLGIIPVIALTGIWLWKFNAFNKLFGIK